MTTEQIIRTMEEIAEVGIVNYRQNDAVKEAIPLLKKQIPVKPVLESPFYYCGNCGKTVVGYKQSVSETLYCERCGQKVKWD